MHNLTQEAAPARLAARGIGFHYPGGDWLFRDLTFAVDPGEIVAVLGPNARGKTTLLTCLAGVREPREGNLSRQTEIGYVPQTHSAEHPFSAHEMVVMGRARKVRAWSSPSASDRDAAWAALERVGLAEYGDRPFRALSGGQRQLVLMARALVCEPGLLILDEPTSALDLRNQRRVLTVMRDLASEGMSVLFTTHDPTHALHVSQRTLLMDRDVRFDETQGLLTAECLSELYQTPVKTAEVLFEAGPRTVVAPDLLTKGSHEP